MKKHNFVCIPFTVLAMIALLSACNPFLGQSDENIEYDSWYYVANITYGSASNQIDIARCIASDGEPITPGRQTSPWVSPQYRRLKNAPRLDIGFHASVGIDCEIRCIIYVNGVNVGAPGVGDYQTGADISFPIGDLSGFSVKYYDNGATGGKVPVDSTKYRDGDSVVVAGNTGGLQALGFGFLGWNTVGNGSGTFYSAGSTLTMTSENVKLYAQWAR
jgi:hypothetical protein